MKTTNLRLATVLFAVLFAFTACDGDLDSPNCVDAGGVVHSIQNGQGTIKEDPDTGLRILSYHVPGTIDSIYTGVICSEYFPDFLVTEEYSQVTFSGDFRDDKGQIEYDVAMGGEEYFFLDLTFIEQQE